MSLGSNEIDLINSRFGSKQNAIRFYPADRCLLVYLAVNPFEVLSEHESAVRSGKITSLGAQFFTQSDSLLVGPKLTNRQFVRAIATASIAMTQIVNTDPGHSRDLGHHRC